MRLRLIDLSETASRDVFANERRFEQRYPAAARMQGYEHDSASTLAVMAFWDENFRVSQASKPGFVNYAFRKMPQSGIFICQNRTAASLFPYRNTMLEE
jgi:hypothetical protein